jgi:ribosomal protein S18 acetylase RimI-like enzyme
VAARAVAIRRASIDDHPTFVRLFPELGVDDPIPGRDAWAAGYAPFTLIAHGDGADALGFAFTQEYADTGYVRNVVVAPEARRRGVGRALMEATARHLRGAGKARWRLNVGPQNVAARTLYESLGMRTLYASRAVRLPWAAADALPTSGDVVEELAPARDAELEALFDLPRGQLGAQRGMGRTILAARSDERLRGVAVFAPAFPGAFPFRALGRGAARRLIEAMHARVADRPHVNLVIDDDEALVSHLVAGGAEVRQDFLHLAGPLPNV